MSPLPEALRCAPLAAVPGVAHGFFGAAGVGAEPLALPDAPVLTLRQVHGVEIVEVGDRPPAPETEGDGLWTRGAGAILGVKTADCVPMLVAAADGSAVAALHGGWRGLAGGIVTRAVALFRAQGVEPQDLLVGIGPHIGPCCYRVGPEVITALGPVSALRRGPHLYADLGATARQQWLDAGVPAAAVAQVGPCVACGLGYCSFRRDGERAGRQLSLIARRPIIP